MDCTQRSDPSVCFKVEKVVGVSRDGATYQVQWSPVWVSKFHLVGCEHLIQEFLQQQNTQQQQEQNQSEKKQSEQQQQNHHQPERQSPENDINTEMSPEIPVLIHSEHNSDADLFDSQDSTTVIIKCEEEEPDDESHVNLSDIMDDMDAIDNDRCELPSSEPVSMVSSSCSTYHDPICGEILILGNPPALEDSSTPPKTCRKRPRSRQYTKPEEEDANVYFVERKNSPDKNRPYQCDICDKTFSQKSNLTAHVARHSGLRPFRCEICDHAFSQKGHLKSHMHRHSGVRAFHCEICQKSFVEERDLRSHHNRCHKDSVT